MKYLKFLTIAAFCAVLLFSCKSEEFDAPTVYTESEWQTLTQTLDLPTYPFPYGFREFSPGVTHNHIATLGRVLFYDESFSLDGKVSCASCHDQALGFSDNKAFSDGPNGAVTDRNSISLSSVGSFGSTYGGSSRRAKTPLFWDHRADNVFDQLEETINNEKEMGVSLDFIRSKMIDVPHYQVLHQKAFGNQVPSDHTILSALSGFLNSIETTSKVDKEMDKFAVRSIEDDFPEFSEKENYGRILFARHCNSCHGNSTTRFFSASIPNEANNGLEMDYNDIGLAKVTNLNEDIGVFKIPGLRNIELSAPYMHDGRFATLEEVVDFYNDGIQNHPNLHPNLNEVSGMAPKKLNLTDYEKEALVDFLEAFTDENFASVEKWSDPFK